MEIERYYLPIPMQLFFRPTPGGNRVMILGVCNKLPELPKQGEIVIGHVQVYPDARYDPAESYRDLRADQILVRSIDLKRLHKKTKEEK